MIQCRSHPYIPNLKLVSSILVLHPNWNPILYLIPCSYIPHLSLYIPWLIKMKEEDSTIYDALFVHIPISWNLALKFSGSHISTKFVFWQWSPKSNRRLTQANKHVFPRIRRMEILFYLYFHKGISSFYYILLQWVKKNLTGDKEVHLLRL